MFYGEKECYIKDHIKAINNSSFDDELDPYLNYNKCGKYKGENRYFVENSIKIFVKNVMKNV